MLVLEYGLHGGIVVVTILTLYHESKVDPFHLPGGRMAS